MTRASMAFALGALFCHQLQVLPDPLLIGVCALLLLVVHRVSGSAAAMTFFLLGLGWTQLHAYHRLQTRLPADLEAQDLSLVVQVAGIPVAGLRSTRFQARVVEVADAPHWSAVGCIVELRSYLEDLQIKPGQRWQFNVRLRLPRGTRNPGDWDAEHRALRSGICAVGYVRLVPSPRRIAGPRPVSLDAVRAHLAKGIVRAVSDLPGGGLVLAMTVGERSHISESQRQLLRNTGTSHLVAISGLHVGMVAVTVMALGRLLMMGAVSLCRWCPAHDVSLMLGLVSALSYAALAGFTVPTQRAFLMVAVFCLAGMRRRRCALLSGWCTALFVVLVADPLAVVGMDLWLSFTAALALLCCMRVSRAAKPRSSVAALYAAKVIRYFAVLIKVQMIAGLALMPLSLFFFGQQAWLGPLYNAVAVPLVGMLAVPLALLGLVLQATGLPSGEWMLQISAQVLGAMLVALRWMVQLEPDWHPGAAIGVWGALCASMAVVLALGSVRKALWPLSAVLCAPLLWPQPHRPAPGELWLDVLDVGQGLASMVQTRDHLAVYDTGPPFHGVRVMRSALRRRGQPQLDVLLLSHGDIDHAGGVTAVLDSMMVRRVISNTVINDVAITACHEAQSWTWNDYRFQVVHPATPRSGNNGSCVLLIQGPGGAILLPGDIEAVAEKKLVPMLLQVPPVDVLVAPHHGSRSSSTRAFLSALQPSLAVVPSGHGNRFRFPHEQVLRRYRALGIRTLDTACSGRVRIILSTARAPRIETWWPGARRFWHSPTLAAHCTDLDAHKPDPD